MKGRTGLETKYYVVERIDGDYAWLKYEMLRYEIL